MRRTWRAPEVASAAGAGLLASLQPALAAALIAGSAAAILSLSLSSLGLARLLTLASFLSGLAIPAGSWSVRPEQIAALLALAALLARRRVAPLPGAASAVVLWVAVGALSGLGEPESARALAHTARLALTVLPVVLLPALLGSRGTAEKAWDVFLALCVAEGALALLLRLAHPLLGVGWGVEIQTGFSLPYTAARGTLLEPNLLGALSAAAAVAFALRLPRRPLSSSLCLAVLAAASVASLTRAAWAAFFLALAAVLVVSRRLAGRALAAPLAWLAVAALPLLLAVWLLGPRLAERLEVRSGLLGKVGFLLHVADDPNVATRLRTYRRALELWGEAPLLGRGHGAMERLAAPEDRTLAWAGNLEVHLLVDTGLAGLALVLGFAALVALRVAGAAAREEGEGRRRQLERLGVLAVLLICAQATETTWLASLWVVFGLALAATGPASSPRDARARVLYVHPSDELYGSDRVLLELVSRLDRERFAPEVLLSSDVAYAGRLSRRLAALPVPVHRRRLGVLRRQALATPSRAARFLLDVAVSTVQLARLLRAQRIDLVHANTVTVFPAALAARLTGTPLVWHVHEIVSEHAGRGLLHAMVRIFADRVAVVSQAARSALGAERWRTPVEVIPNGVERREGSEGPLRPPVLAYVGRLSKRKGPHVFLEAAKLLAARHPDARFVFAGDELGGGAELSRDLLEEAARSGLAGRVELRAFREDVRDLLGEATAVVSPSILPESFGLVILEAMAAGRPVVASDHGGPRELIVDGETGYLVPPGDPHALAGALDQLLGDPQLAARMGEASRQRAATHFPIESSVRRFEDLYRELLREAPAAGRAISGRPSSPPEPRGPSRAS